MAKFEFDSSSFGRLRWIGYGLLLFSLIDNIDTLYPLQFMNPIWEVQTIGTIVERVPVPLVAFGLIFVGEYYGRPRAEKWLAAFLSWLCLVLAVAFLFMIPLGIFGSLRINTQSQAQLEAQVKQQQAQLALAEQRVQQSQPAQLQVLVQQLQRQGMQIQGTNPDAVRAEVLSQIAATKRDIQNRSQSVRSTQQRTLLKNAIKWNIGAIISSVMFFVIWKTTDWTRKRPSDLPVAQAPIQPQGQPMIVQPQQMIPQQMIPQPVIPTQPIPTQGATASPVVQVPQMPTIPQSSAVAQVSIPPVPPAAQVPTVQIITPQVVTPDSPKLDLAEGATPSGPNPPAPQA